MAPNSTTARLQDILALANRTLARPCIGSYINCARSGTETIMDDQFLNQYREPPRPDFARQLQDKIDGGTMKVAKQKTWRQNLMRWSPALVAAAILVAAVMIITLPP